MRIERYSSVESYTKLCLQKKKEHFAKGGYDPTMSFTGSHSYSWDLGVGYDKAIELALNGDKSIAAKCASQVDDLVNKFAFRQTMRSRYSPSLAGTRVSIPDYLAGSPLSMR